MGARLTLWLRPSLGRSGSEISERWSCFEVAEWEGVALEMEFLGAGLGGCKWVAEVPPGQVLRRVKERRPWLVCNLSVYAVYFIKVQRLGLGFTRRCLSRAPQVLDFCVWECHGPTRVTYEGLEGLAVFAGYPCLPSV